MHARMFPLFAIVIVAVMAALLAGCWRDSRPNVDNPGDGAESGTEGAITSGTEGGSTETVPLDLAEDATLVGVKFHEAGSWMGPYYSVRQTDDGFVCATTLDQVFWPTIDGEDYEEYAAETGYCGAWGDGDPYENGRVSVTTVTDADMAQLYDALNSCDILSWNGYSASYSPPEGVMDMDDYFTLQLLFSDGNVLEAHGYNRRPSGYAEVVTVLRDFFAEHEDYSAYYPTELPDSPVTRLLIEFGDTSYSPGRTIYKIELVRSWQRWSIVLSDPSGTFLPAGTDVHEYADTEEELPFDVFLDLIREHGLESWNGTEEYVGGDSTHWRISIYFENGQEYSVDTNVSPDGFEEFERACIQEMAAYYDRMAS